MFRTASQAFHRVSKNALIGHAPIPPDPKDWPEEWKTIFYKRYARLPALELTLNGHRQADVFELMQTRESRRDFQRVEISREELSMLLKYSCGIMQHPHAMHQHRAQPSGGGRFPIEMYLMVLHADAAADGVPTGLYHYDVKDHRLEILVSRQFKEAEMSQLFYDSWVKDASVVLVMTAVFRRSQHKYGERGYRLILLEAGHIGQNLYLVSEALGLKCCALGGVWDEGIEQLLDLDGVGESLVYTIAVGK